MKTGRTFLAFAAVVMDLNYGQFLLENATEFDALTLYASVDEDVRPELAKFKFTTAWVESGYSHAKEYTLDLMMQIDTTEEMQQGRHIFWYIIWPKLASTETNPIYETIYADYNPNIDTRFSFYQVY